MPPADDLAFASIADIGPRIRRGEVSPVELTRACLDRIAAPRPVPQRLHHRHRRVGARRGASGRTGHPAGPLPRAAPRHPRRSEGPDVHPRRAHHRRLEGPRGLRAGLRRGGCHPTRSTLARSDSASSTSTSSPPAAPARTRTTVPCTTPGTWTHNPGGSSGGSGAALAAGLCLGATGSDTAGSIRIPSHACGTTGIKPTYGRVSCFGVIPLSWSLDHVGPMTRSAADAALMLNVMAGFDRRDSATVDRRWRTSPSA